MKTTTTGMASYSTQELIDYVESTDQKFTTAPAFIRRTSFSRWNSTSATICAEIQKRQGLSIPFPLARAEILDFIMFSNDQSPYALISDPITYTKTGYVEAQIRRFCVVRRDFVGPTLLLNSWDNNWKFIPDKKVSEMMGVSEESHRAYWKGE